MKSLILFIALVCPVLPAIATEDLVALRKTVKESVNNSKAAFSFHRSMQKAEINGNAVMLGYKAMSELLLCKHVFSPISKLSHFNRGKLLLETSISLEPDNAELRYYRYCTQLNAPGFLNYSSNLEEDKQFLFNFLETQSRNAKKDLDLYVHIKTFLFTNRYATAQDKENLKAI